MQASTSSLKNPQFSNARVKREKNNKNICKMSFSHFFSMWEKFKKVYHPSPSIWCDFHIEIHYTHRRCENVNSYTW